MPCWDFDGTDDELSINADPAIFKITGAYSLFCWFQWDGAGTATHLFGKWSTTAGTKAYRLTITSTNFLRHQHRTVTPAGDDNATGAVAVNGATTTWWAAGGSWTPSSAHKVYLNGVANTSASTPADMADTTSHLQLGENHGDTEDFDGRIAHVAIWNVALSDAEHASLATGVRPDQIQAANLKGYWTPALASSSPWSDLSGNGNNMVAVAGVTVVDLEPPLPAAAVGPPVGAQFI